MSLCGKVALVTGATSGIAAIARLFASQGAKIIATGTNTRALALLEAELGEGNCVALAGDVTSDKDVASVVERGVQKFSKIDCLVNNAGVLQGGAVDNVDMTNLDFNMNVNCRGAFCFMLQCIPHLKQAAADSGDASIINISSVNGMQSFEGA